MIKGRTPSFQKGKIHRHQHTFYRNPRSHSRAPGAPTCDTFIATYSRQSHKPEQQVCSQLLIFEGHAFVPARRTEAEAANHQEENAPARADFCGE
jgi:hypothetical protein